MKIYLPMYQFILLALSTAFATYFFNRSMMTGQYLFVMIWGSILLRNLHSSYQLSKFIRAIEARIDKMTKKKD
ncbi:DUF3272 family protein [Streptococcus moroccensis]|uniref:DUF3272 family protein n=1 Tax=Streptococcus moroccensis TaxID=1451356 RepID=UPI0027D7E5DF|nr:DUF3272 family protein [Streptococcus moroccensis]